MSVDTFISRMAHGNIITDESNVTTVSYTSPYGDRATVTPKPLPSQKGKNRQYISYEEQTGKDPEKDTNNNGESEIELFIDELKDMLLPNNRSFIDILNSDSNDIYNIDVVGYVVATYAQTLLNYAESTITQFSTTDFMNNHTKVTSSGLKFKHIESINVIINSDLPEPVIPAISPCGPWNFSCKSNMNNSPSLLRPIGTLKLFTGLLVAHLSNIFSCSTFPTLYISRNPTEFFISFNTVSDLIGIFDNFSHISGKLTSSILSI
jgi:hypothetical protein